MGLHFFPYLTGLGLGEGAAALIYSVCAISMTASKPVWGFLIDKYGVRRVGIAAFASLTTAQATLVILSGWPSLWLVSFVALFAGFAMAGHPTVAEVFWANYFGRLSLGTVRTIASPFSIISAPEDPSLPAGSTTVSAVISLSGLCSPLPMQ